MTKSFIFVDFIYLINIQSYTALEGHHQDMLRNETFRRFILNN